MTACLDGGQHVLVTVVLGVASLVHARSVHRRASDLDERMLARAAMAAVAPSNAWGFVQLSRLALHGSVRPLPALAFVTLAPACILFCVFVAIALASSRELLRSTTRRGLVLLSSLACAVGGVGELIDAASI